MKYDLEERTAKFGEEIIRFVRLLSKDMLMRPLASQIVRSDTSIGANYMEANQGSSRKDFRNEISICRKEANETKHWIRTFKDAAMQRLMERSPRINTYIFEDLPKFFLKIKNLKLKINYCIIVPYVTSRNY